MLRRRKALQERKARDDLDGWLVDEEGNRLGRKVPGAGREEESDGSSSVDGLSLLELEEKRKRRRLELSGELDSLLSGVGGTGATERRPARVADVGYGGSDWYQDEDDGTPMPCRYSVFLRRSTSQLTKHGVPAVDLPPRLAAAKALPLRKPKHHASRREPSTAFADDDSSSDSQTTIRPSKRFRRSSDPEHSRDRQRADPARRQSPHGGERGQSEPPTSSPAKSASAPRRQLSSLKKLRRGKHGVHVVAGAGIDSTTRAASHARGAQTGGQDGELLDIVLSQSERDSTGSGLDLGSDDDQSNELGSDGSSGDEQPLPPAPGIKLSRSARLQLDKKRFRQLCKMMPRRDAKIAVKDLAAMEREQAEAAGAVFSDVGSGDEEAEEEERLRLERAERYRAKMRLKEGLIDDGPMRFEGEAFTDESGSDGRELEPSTEEGDASEEDVEEWWAGGQGRNTARQCADGRDGGDVLDSFLKKARRDKRKAKTARSKHRRPKARNSDPHAQDLLVNRSAAPRDDARVGPAGTEPPRIRRSKNAVGLDTGAALFDFARRGRAVDVALARAHTSTFPNGVAPSSVGTPCTTLVSRPAPSSAHVVPTRTTALPTAPSSTAAPNAAEENERWSQFSRFSHDFGIARLPSGAQFVEGSFVRLGHLFDLLRPGQEVSFRAFDGLGGIHADTRMAADEAEGLLPQLCDGVFDIAETLLATPPDTEPAPQIKQTVDEVGRLMRWLGKFVDKTTNESVPTDAWAFAAGLSAQLDRLGARLDALDRGLEDKPRVYQALRLRLDWYGVDLAVRGGEAERLDQTVARLVRRLVDWGIERTGDALKAISAVGAEDAPESIEEASIECWLGLVSLSLSDRTQFDEAALWVAVEHHASAGLGEQSLATAEVLSYTACVLCAVSQISPSGRSSPNPRLTAHWSLLRCALDQVKPEQLQSNVGLSNTTLARRDKYLWTVLARLLVMTERWGWDVDAQLLGTVFARLNARRLGNLGHEQGRADFPKFLRELDLLEGPMTLEPRDTAFVVFLKLVVRAARQVDVADVKTRQRQLTRLFTRLTPISTQWTRNSPELSGPAAQSVLVNHLSLFVTFAALDPGSLASRLGKVRDLVAFGEIGSDARIAVIRAGLHFGLLCKREGVALGGVVDWWVSVVTHLKQEHQALGKEQGKAGGLGKLDGRRQVALQLCLILRSVQNVIEADARVAGQNQADPDPELLNPAWVDRLLDSSAGREEIVGREIGQLVDCFLNSREHAARRIQAEPQGDSQDEYGMFDDDDALWDDPAVAAMMGVEEQPQATGGQPSGEERDREFVQVSLYLDSLTE